MRLVDKVVLFRLAEMDAPASQEDLAAQLSCCSRTVRRSIRRLAKCGHITIVGKGHRTPYAYQINYDRLPASIRAELCR